MNPNESRADKHASRRTVLKAGAHVAWAVPAVQIAGQVPALAASPGHTVDLGIVSPSATAITGSGNSWTSTISAKVQNTGTDTASSISVTPTSSLLTSSATPVLIPGDLAAGATTATAASIPVTLKGGALDHTSHQLTWLVGLAPSGIDSGDPRGSVSTTAGSVALSHAAADLAFVPSRTNGSINSAADQNGHYQVGVDVVYTNLGAVATDGPIVFSGLHGTVTSVKNAVGDDNTGFSVSANKVTVPALAAGATGGFLAFGYVGGRPPAGDNHSTVVGTYVTQGVQVTASISVTYTLH